MSSEKQRIKFYQITGVGLTLYALDADQQVWIRNKSGKWSKVEHPEIEIERTYIGTRTVRTPLMESIVVEEAKNEKETKES